MFLFLWSQMISHFLARMFTMYKNSTVKWRPVKNDNKRLKPKKAEWKRVFPAFHEYFPTFHEYFPTFHEYFPTFHEYFPTFHFPGAVVDTYQSISHHQRHIILSLNALQSPVINCMRCCCELINTLCSK